MAKYLLIQAIIIYAIRNGCQFCLFSVSSLQISTQNGVLMSHQYYKTSWKKKPKNFIYPFFPIQKENPCRHSLIINLNADQFVWSV